ncbi:MAG: DHH family phosphoesterase [Eubacteriales bacterium]|nr:DHH family phosphoesterase [Eubacteriales bacterium]
MMEALTKEIFNDNIKAAKSICVLGHVSPDGDCVGSTLAVYNYINNMRAGEDFRLQNYLEPINDKFLFMNGSGLISDDSGDGKVYELAIVCDCGDEKRMGRFEKYYKHAKKALLIDHHFTNVGFGDFGIVRGDASSTAEVLYDLFEERYFDKNIAECLYTGLAHDTGVFRYSSTSTHTMEIASKCMEAGINFTKIIDESFFAMNFDQKIVLGTVLGNMKKRMDGKLVYSSIDMETRKKLNAEDMDMDGMIDQIRTTTDALVGVYMYETKDGRVKISLRSNSDLVDVSRVASANCGGGHKKAAGCFMSLDFEKNMDEIEADVRSQLG